MIIRRHREALRRHNYELKEFCVYFKCHDIVDGEEEYGG